MYIHSYCKICRGHGRLHISDSMHQSSQRHGLTCTGGLTVLCNDSQLTVSMQKVIAVKSLTCTPAEVESGASAAPRGNDLAKNVMVSHMFDLRVRTLPRFGSPHFLLLSIKHMVLLCCNSL